jgi:uncharacterized protein (DUF1778 family)
LSVNGRHGAGTTTTPATPTARSERRRALNEMSIYELKPRFQATLRPLVRRMHAVGILANQVTLAACAVSLALGIERRQDVHFQSVPKDNDMPQTTIENNSRLALRVRANDKAMLMRAVALEHTDMTDFVLRHALDAARKVIERAERLTLSERDSLRVLKALANPAAPSAKLLAAARRLPRTK